MRGKVLIPPCLIAGRNENFFKTMILVILKFFASVILTIIGFIFAVDKIWSGVFFTSFLIVLMYWEYLFK